jgi:hypothetical protein
MRELAQTDAEVFKSRTSMQELKTGYLKARFCAILVVAGH